MTFAPAPPAWPVVIGIISMVLGALSAVFNLISLLMLPFATSISQQSMISVQQNAGGVVDHQVLFDHQAAAIKATYLPTLLAYSFGLLTAALLFVAGLYLVRRHVFGRTGSLIYVGFKALHIGIFVLSQWVAMDAVLTEEFSAAANMPAVLPKAFAIGGIVISALMLFAYPAFLLVWFLLPGVNREVNRWKKPGSEVAAAG